MDDRRQQEPDVDAPGAESWFDDPDEDTGDDDTDLGTRPRRRLRSGILIAATSLVAAALIAGTLLFVVRSVQNGIGGIFPQPVAALDRFEQAAEGMPDVGAARDLAQRQTAIFAGYDVIALVDAQAGLSDAEQQRLVESLSAQTDASSGNGVAVYAQAQFGDLRVAVSPARSLSDRRLALGQQLAAMGGVDRVSCGWTVKSGDPIADDGSHQTVTVETDVPDADYPALQASITTAVHAAMPDAQMTITRAAP